MFTLDTESEKIVKEALVRAAADLTIYFATARRDGTYFHFKSHVGVFWELLSGALKGKKPVLWIKDTRAFFFGDDHGKGLRGLQCYFRRHQNTEGQGIF